MPARASGFKSPFGHSYVGRYPSNRTVPEWSRAMRVDLRQIERTGSLSPQGAKLSRPKAAVIEPVRPLEISLVRISTIEKNRLSLGPLGRSGFHFGFEILRRGITCASRGNNAAEGTSSADNRGRAHVGRPIRREYGSAPLSVLREINGDEPIFRLKSDPPFRRPKHSTHCRIGMSPGFLENV